MSLKKKYPYNEGWLHLKMNLVKGKTLTDEQAINIATCGQQDKHEIAHVEHLKTCVKVIFKQIEKVEP